MSQVARLRSSRVRVAKGSALELPAESGPALLCASVAEAIRGRRFPAAHASEQTRAATQFQTSCRIPPEPGSSASRLDILQADGWASNVYLRSAARPAGARQAAIDAGGNSLYSRHRFSPATMKLTKEIWYLDKSPAAKLAGGLKGDWDRRALTAKELAPS